MDTLYVIEISGSSSSFDWAALFIQSIIAIATVIIAVIAVRISIRHGQRTMQHNKMSVRPAIDLAELFGGLEDNIGIKMINSGLGPANIKKMRLFVKNREFGGVLKSEWEEVIKALGIEALTRHSTKPISWTGFSPECFLQAGEWLWLIRCKVDSPEPIKEAFMKCLYHLKIIVEYESIYGDKFSSTYDPKAF